ncbi:unnamed protein product [Owenia fusiformis]|nr:unnamed protein product [Owenia fusiformis]
MALSQWSMVPVLLLAVLFYLTPTEGCNEAICASVVSKCMLLKSCECEMLDKGNCSCCTDCHQCLADYYMDCCDCVGMCAPPDPNENMYKTSSIEDLSDPIPELFNVLTQEPDALFRWTSYSYPVHEDVLFFKPGMDFAVTVDKQNKLHKVRHHHQTNLNFEKLEDMNCTVAFMSQCMSLNKCKSSCKSMGSARYRWFHDHGCCQCVGTTCVDYGKKKPLCLKCPLPPGEEENNYDYQPPRTDYVEENEIDDSE